MLSERRYKVMSRIIVGNVVKSVGFSIKTEIRIIRTDIAIETVRKKSSTLLGRGTMIIAIMAIIIATIVRSLALAIVSRNGIARFRSFERVALAKE